ncbi:MAG TPA: tetratricopeptide repeat protein [Steroidobacteraceae bacterium]|nr:tetratricopeptide repeat protein [Steroidobacteraceae bacterium]
MSFFAELKRRNVVRVAVVYLVASWLAMQITDVCVSLLELPAWTGKLVFLLLLIGFVPALVFSWAYEITPEGLKREKDVVRDASTTQLTAKRLDWVTIILLVVTVIFVAADRLWLGDRLVSEPADSVEPMDVPAQVPGAASQYPANSIAVLPFVNMSSDVEQEYFSDGIAEELLSLLARIPELQVIARTSSFAFKGKDVRIADVARELNVAHVLEGSVRKSGNQVRITAQLIRSADSTHVWSATYDRTLDDIFAIQDEIAAAVVDELKIKLIGDANPQAEATSPEAYELYLQSRYVKNRYAKETYQQAEALLTEALAIDPGYAPAWDELGGTYLAQGDFGRPMDEARELARAAYEKALAIAPDYAPAYSSLSLLARSEFDFAAAEQYLQQAMRLNSSGAAPFSAAASLSRTFGRFDQSIDFAQKAIAHDPISAHEYLNRGFSCYYAGRFDEAVNSFRKAISLSPEIFRAHYYLGRMLLDQGRSQEALVEMQREPGGMFHLTGLAMAHHALGDTKASDQVLADLIENWGAPMAFQIAEVHAFRGENDAAFEWLQAALETRDPGLGVLLGNPVFKSLTSDVRYRALVEDLGLSRYWQEMSSYESGP